MSTKTNTSLQNPTSRPILLSHAADFRYPGKNVLFRTRIDVTKALFGFSLIVTLPEGVEYVGYRAPEQLEAQVKRVEAEPTTEVVWELAKCSVGHRFDFQVMGQIEPILQDKSDEGAFRESRAVVTLKGPDEDEKEPPIEASASLMPVVLSHVADFYRRYSGESVVFHTRIQVLKTRSSLTLEVKLPPEITFKDSHAPVELGDSRPWLESRQEDGQEEQYVIWDIGRCEAGNCLDYEVEGQIRRLGEDSLLESVGIIRLMDQEKKSLSASATIQVKSKSDYLRYLPGIYQKDELMGRFLMLFESFWKPIEEQIDHIPFYFDPQMAPPALLPWLASVLNQDLNPNWPEERKRHILNKASDLYRQRGTKRGLKEYLEISTGGKVEITEHHGKNMILGPRTRLGTGIALGKDNKAHTFTVILHSLPSTTSENADVGSEDYERWIRAMIDAQSPAHTKYYLQIEPEKEKDRKSE